MNEGFKPNVSRQIYSHRLVQLKRELCYVETESKIEPKVHIFPFHLCISKLKWKKLKISRFRVLNLINNNVK